MKRILIGLAVVMGLVLVPAEATAAPAAPSGGWVSVDTVRAGTLGGIAKAWDSATKRKVCSAFSYKPRKAANIVARIHLRNGWYPKRNVRKGTRQALKLVC